MCKPGSTCCCPSGGGFLSVVIPGAVILAICAGAGAVYGAVKGILPVAEAVIGGSLAIAAVTLITVIALAWRRMPGLVHVWARRPAVSQYAVMRLAQRRQARLAASQTRALPAPAQGAPVPVITDARHGVLQGQRHD